MTIHILAIVADLAAFLATTCNALTFHQDIKAALHYLQCRTFPYATSAASFDARVKAIETLANLFTVLTYLSDVRPSHAVLALTLILLITQERDQ